NRLVRYRTPSTSTYPQDEDETRCSRATYSASDTPAPQARQGHQTPTATVFDFDRLHVVHAICALSTVVLPPLLHGILWSQCHSSHVAMMPFPFFLFLQTALLR